MGEAFSVGSRVHARGLACDVIEVAPLGTQLLLRLCCVTGDRLLSYSRDFIEASGGRHSTFLELRDNADVTVARRMFPGKRRIQDLGIALSRELHMTDDAASFEPVGDLRCAGPAASGYFVLHEGRRSTSSAIAGARCLALLST